ncbi:hypothetical protein I4U23_005090 [Adineta vaga]|nr:hypothetical protein I4U23_005090 [Adineta vaga]
MSTSDQHAYALRICDTVGNSHTSVSPIAGYETAPLVSLEKAVEPLELIVPMVRNMVWIVKANCKNPSDNLSPDESASVMLYTLSWNPEDQSFYYILNAILRGEDKFRLKSWFMYLKLLMTALSKLPSERRFLYRGVRKDVVQDFSQEKFFFWWTLTSCTTSIKVLESNQFLGKTNKRTMFTIDSYTGKDIRKHSMVKKEDEVLLLPGSQFKVIAILDTGNHLNMIQIQEIDSKHSSTKSSCTNNIPTSIKSSPVILPKKAHTISNHYNATVEQAIQKCQLGKLNLSGEQLNDQDIVIISDQGIISKQCKILVLMSAAITDQGLSVLSDAIHDNQYLEELNISQNNISDVGVQYLASAMKTSALKRLDLSANDISDEGVKYLAEALQTNLKLIQLSLSENRIGNDGVKVFADILSHGNTILEMLNLSANSSIDDDTISALIAMIEHNQSLKKLDLRHCDFTEDGERELLTAAKSKKKFQLWLSRVM